MIEKHIPGTTTMRKCTKYSAKQSLASAGKVPPATISIIIIAMSNSRTVVTTSPKTWRMRGNPYRSFVSGSLVSVGIPRNSMYRKSIIVVVGSGSRRRAASKRMKLAIVLRCILMSFHNELCNATYQWNGVADFVD